MTEDRTSADAFTREPCFLVHTSTKRAEDVHVHCGLPFSLKDSQENPKPPSIAKFV